MYEYTLASCGENKYRNKFKKEKKECKIYMGAVAPPEINFFKISFLFIFAGVNLKADTWIRLIEDMPEKREQTKENSC